MRVQIASVVLYIDGCMPNIVKLHEWLNRLTCPCGKLVTTDVIRLLIPHMLAEHTREQGFAQRVLVEIEKNPHALTEDTIVDMLLGMGAALRNAQSPAGARCLWDAMYARWGETHRANFVWASRNVIGEDLAA